MNPNNEKGLVGDIRASGKGVLAERFVFPPFSVWNTREGHWQQRKRKWLGIGIESEVGRGKGLTYNIQMGKTPSTSVFDPVVCEMVYRWWCRPSGVIVDPFAGGSVRGIVASVLGYKYWGCDLREEQIVANRLQVTDRTKGEFSPKWVCGDSAEMLLSAPKADLIFSCPPYGDLEKYSEDESDLSAMDRDDFLTAYSDIIAKSAERLRDNRFACFVTGNYRGKDGRLHDLAGDTIRAFESAGLKYYNEIVLLNVAGSAAMRGAVTFINGRRKVVKIHQNIMVFLKGDATEAASTIPTEEEV